MKHENLTSSVGNQIHVVLWDEVESPKGVLQIVHGMAEHIERYQDIAEYLNKKGYIVIGQSLRGHGNEALEDGTLGYLGNPGWTGLIQEVKDVTVNIKNLFPALPIGILGHSMGSFVVRTLMFDAFSEKYLSTVILSGTGDQPRILSEAALLLAKIEMAFRGPKAPSNRLTSLSFGKYNDRFKPNRTPFDWLSRDTEIVDAYVNDPRCGSVFTVSFYEQLLRGLLNLDKFERHNLRNYKGRILFISGSEDPLLNGGKTFDRLMPIYQGTSAFNVEKILIPGARHEVLNEINREGLYNEISEWLDLTCCS